MLLRRELSKLASQILTVARTQGMAQVQQPRMVVEVDPGLYRAQRDRRAASAPSRAGASEQRQPAHAGNGAAHEEHGVEDAAPEVDTMAAGMGRAGAQTAEEPEADRRRC